MAAEAATNARDLSQAAADDAFFTGLYESALAVTPPPSSSTRRPALQWSSSDGVAETPPCDPCVAATDPTTPSEPLAGVSGGAVPVGSGIEMGRIPGTQDPPLSLLGARATSDAGGSLAQPQEPPGSSSGYPTNDCVVAPARMVAPEATAMATMFTHPTAAVATAESQPANASGLSKAAAKVGGARRARKPRRTTATGAARPPKQQEEVDPEDGEPDNTVCLLAVGPKKPAGPGALHTANSAASLAATIGMLTVEIGRNGRVTETEHVETGERAVVQVKALAECEMRFGIVVLEVEESLTLAATTAKSLRAANDSTPIVAVGPAHAFRDAPAQLMPGEGWLSFNEILVFPISAANVRGLVARYLLSPQHITAVAVSSGLAGQVVSPGPTAAMTFGQLGQHTAGDGDLMMASTLPAAAVAFGQGPSQLQQHPDQSIPQQQEGLSNDATWVVPYNPEDGGGGVPLPGRMPSVPLGKPRASTLFSLEARVFGGGAEDRASPCRLFGQEFAKKDAQMEEREYDFVFRHGTIVLRVAEDGRGNAVPVIFSACEYATGHFGKSFIGKPLKWLFDHPATNQKTVTKILRHIEQSDTDSMCSYINLRREGQWVTSSFVSLRSLSRRPKRGSGETPPEWYVLLKVCLPSTLGLIKEPELLESMYSKKASNKTTTAAAAKIAKRSRSKAGLKRTPKKAKMTPAASDNLEAFGASPENMYLACPAPGTQPG